MPQHVLWGLVDVPQGEFAEQLVPRAGRPLFAGAGHKQGYNRWLSTMAAHGNHPKESDGGGLGIKIFKEPRHFHSAARVENPWSS